MMSDELVQDLRSQNGAVVRLAECVIARPELAEPLLRLLDEAGGDLEKLASFRLSRPFSDGDILASSEIARTSHASIEFQPVFQGDFSSLAVRPGFFGAREISFVLKGGARNLGVACTEINEKLSKLPNFPQDGFSVRLSQNINDDLSVAGDITVVYIPVIRNSANRVRCGENPDESHQVLLESLGLLEVNNSIHRLACGAFRVAQGFPLDQRVIGTRFDPGDLNEGMVVRTKKGAFSGAVGTYHNGIYDSAHGVDGWRDDEAQASFCVAGMVSQEANEIVDG